jgi:hypothetical protein
MADPVQPLAGCGLVATAAVVPTSSSNSKVAIAFMARTLSGSSARRDGVPLRAGGVVDEVGAVVVLAARTTTVPYIAEWIVYW